MNRICHALLASMVVLAAGCAPSGPVELLDEVDAERGDCARTVTCLERGEQAAKAGRFTEAVPDLKEACRGGRPAGCRLLADLKALGAIGEPDFEMAASLYRWSCRQREDGASCHSLGELHRLGAVDGEGTAEEWFRRACQLGEPAGCHDEFVVRLRSEPADDDLEGRAADVFGETCGKGFAPGCVNRGYMLAAGRGVGRDHGAAAELFAAACDEQPGWEPHRLASLTRADDPDVYSTAEYESEVACEQKEVLVVGGYEERIIAAFDAEEETLRGCYDEASFTDGLTGKVSLVAGVSTDGDGINPRVDADELDSPEVRGCVEEMLSRHLDDPTDAEAAYRTEWVISFLPSPAMDLETGGSGETRCDRQEIRDELGDSFDQMRACGTRHVERHPEDPGAVVVRWNFGTDGDVDAVETTSTVTRGALSKCLSERVEKLQISPFDRGPCDVQAPFSFSAGDLLHFTVVGRATR